ncbi:MAG TPA: NAD(P)/FAD-dependent oxidoreductase [Vicinamibacterales bacterium]|nr:NAD(P)/FAD-dependent oxidoreductase [Vicinamibacterales bacterium]
MLDALIIGAGPAGLAASRALSRAGVGHRVLERGDDLGHTWAHLYDSLVLHTGKHLSALPGLRFPAATPIFPSRLDLLDYLHRYAETFQVPVETRAHVTRVDRVEDTWTVRTAGGALYQARSLIVATGVVANPFVPELPGREVFRGRIMHSVDYHRPGDVRGTRILVAGAGNSAGEISVELARTGADVTLAVRTGAVAVPRSVLGVPVQYLGVLLSPIPPAAQRALAAGLGSLARLTRGRAPLPPPAPTACPKVPLIGLHLTDMIRSGRIRVRSGIAAFTADAVRFSDGSEERFDQVILATGYRAALGPLRHLITVEPCGFARRRGRVTSADHPGLFFVGHTYSIAGAIFNIAGDARAAAGAVRAHLSAGR